MPKRKTIKKKTTKRKTTKRRVLKLRKNPSKEAHAEMAERYYKMAMKTEDLMKAFENSVIALHNAKLGGIPYSKYEKLRNQLQEDINYQRYDEI